MNKLTNQTSDKNKKLCYNNIDCRGGPCVRPNLIIMNNIYLEEI